MRGSGWFKQDAGWYWITGSGAAATGWAKVKGKWYYFDSASALMKTGWQKVDNVLVLPQCQWRHEDWLVQARI